MPSVGTAGAGYPHKELVPVSSGWNAPTLQVPLTSESNRTSVAKSRMLTFAVAGRETGSIPLRLGESDCVIVTLVRFDVYVKLTKLQLVSSVPNV